MSHCVWCFFQIIGQLDIEILKNIGHRNLITQRHTSKLEVLTGKLS